MTTTAETTRAVIERALIVERDNLRSITERHEQAVREEKDVAHYLHAAEQRVADLEAALEAVKP